MLGDCDRVVDVGSGAATRSSSLHAGLGWWLPITASSSTAAVRRLSRPNRSPRRSSPQAARRWRASPTLPMRAAPWRSSISALKAFGRLDVVVNNAGIYAGDWFDGVDNAQFRRMVEYHYLGTVFVSKAAWPHLKSAEHGCIVNTTSEAVVGHIPKSPDYAGAKGAVFAFTKALALNGKMHGVRVNAVAPRGNTRMSGPDVLSKTFDEPEENFINEFFDNMKPEYVSPAVAFLAHDSCSLTGEVIVCGGLQAMRLALIETIGLTFENNITPEDLAENVDRLMDTKDAHVMGLDLWG